VAQATALILTKATAEEKQRLSDALDSIKQVELRDEKAARLQRVMGKRDAP
jgi:hypothetical protein